MQIRGRRAAQLRVHSERLQDTGDEIVVKGHLRALGDVVGKCLEADIRVDAPPAGLPGWRAGLERETGRVREEMSHRRPVWPRRLVEIDHALLCRNQGRESRDELRHRRPAQHLARCSVRRNDLAASQHTRGGEGCRPVVDLPECLFHGGRY